MPDPIPSCFTGETNKAAAAPPVQSLVTCTYRTKLAGQCRFLTVTWCKNAMGHGLCVSVDDPCAHSACKVELKPWYFWRKHGCKAFEINGKKVDVWWDLGSAKFTCGPEPQEGFHVAVVCDDEVVLLLGDLRKEALKKSKAREPSIEATLVSRKEHVFGRRVFTSRARLSNDASQDRVHEIVIECQTSGPRGPELKIKIDGKAVLLVKRLAWKFRGNQTLKVNGLSVQFFWDVHDWLFNSRLGHATFIFKPAIIENPSTEHELNSSMGSIEKGISRSSSSSNDSSNSQYSLLIYAWKVD